MTVRVLGPTPTDVLGVVEEMTGVPLGDIVGDKHQPYASLPVQARFVACWVIRHATPASFPEIAATVRRDHTTVMHACQRVSADARLLAAGKAVLAEVQRRFPSLPLDQPAGNPQVDGPDDPQPAPVILDVETPPPPTTSRPEPRIEPSPPSDEPPAVSDPEGPDWAQERPCGWCENLFKPRHRKQLYCRRECADEAEVERQRSRWTERKRVEAS